ncbi:MAG: hypothetical protein AB1324_08155 [Candidatus Micrarchaeota archaeon]
MQQQLLSASPRPSRWAFWKKAPSGEAAPRPAEPCEVLFDRVHFAANPRHQGVVDVFNRWKAIPDGTFSRGRETALIRAFYSDEPAEMVREMSVARCPNFAAYLPMDRYGGRLYDIMNHTRMLHLNRSGVDHFGIPIFDLELLKLEGHEGALRDIRHSVTEAILRNRCDLSDARAAYYVFQGYRILRFMERIMDWRADWAGLSGKFPDVPVPGPLDMSTDLAEPEKLEARSFAKHINTRGSIIT